MTNPLSYEMFWNDISQIDETFAYDNEKFLKPENRSSTIFPVFKDLSTKTTIQFLSYWLKKHGNNVIARFTLRDLVGEQLLQWHEAITACKAYSLQVTDHFNDTKKGFCGSVEVEIFTKQSPLYTFPAISVCYEGKKSSSVVHSCIRTYNTGEVVSDYAIMLPQTGFDVDISDHNTNFICFFGGVSETYRITIEIIEGDRVKLYPLELRNDRYGQMHIIWIENILDDEDIHFFKKPKCLIHHNLHDVFPRFYVGIRNKAFAPTVTHTFFDTSNAEQSEQDDKLNLRAQNSDHANYFDASFSVPLFPSECYNTSLRTYGQNLDFNGTSILQVHTLEGEIIYSRNLTKQEIVVLNGDGTLDLAEMLQSADLDPKNNYSARFGFVSKTSPFPKRFKLGLNVKRNDFPYGTNICFAPLVVSERTLSKPFNRRWFPIGGPQNYVATIHNTSLNRTEVEGLTECNFEFFNHQGEALSRQLNIPLNGSVFIDVKEDRELKMFLGSEGGWCMVNSKTYFCDAYFFSIADAQVGGDHAY